MRSLWLLDLKEEPPAVGKARDSLSQGAKRDDNEAARNRKSNEAAPP